MTTITLAFKDSEDADMVLRSIGMLKTSEGSLPPLYNGLTSSALRKAEIVEVIDTEKEKG